MLLFYIARNPRARGVVVEKSKKMAAHRTKCGKNKGDLGEGYFSGLSKTLPQKGLGTAQCKYSEKTPEGNMPQTGRSEIAVANFCRSGLDTEARS
jgi:hypothetical protein